MARDQVALMRALGHERFLLVGHDRGGRVAHRLAVDIPRA
jgi:haloacetate dehalogenase